MAMSVRPQDASVAVAMKANTIRLMKRRDLIVHLQAYRCRRHRQGGNHEVWLNPANRAESAVGRHREIPIGTVRAICRQLGIEAPKGNR